MKSDLAIFLTFLTALAVAEPIDLSADPPAKDAAPKAAKSKPEETPFGPYSDVLHYFSGDTLHGNIVTATPKFLTWTRPDFGQPYRCQTGGLQRLDLARRSSVQAVGGGVELTNGDTLAGTVVDLDGERLRLGTSYAGELTVPRAMLRRISPGRQSYGALFEGGDRLADWKRHSGKWSVDSRGLTGSGGAISRQLALPDQASVSMKVAWTDRTPNLSIISHSDPRDYSKQGYNLHVSRGSIALVRGTGRSMGRAPFNFPSRPKEATFEMSIDRTSGTVRVHCNGRFVKAWTTGYRSTGSSLTLCANGGSKTLFSQIRVSAGIGRRRFTTPKHRKISEDRVFFGDDDRLSGKIAKIADGKLEFDSESGRLSIPLEDAREIVFNDAEAERARRRTGDVELYFVGGERITMQLVELSKGVVVGDSENFGLQTFDLEYLTGIRFNVYRKDTPP